MEIHKVNRIPTIETVSDPSVIDTDLGRLDKFQSQNGLTQDKKIGIEEDHFVPDEWTIKKTVLIVDDDVDLLREMVDALRDFQLYVVFSITAEEAILKAKMYKPTYIIMDYNLPDLNGLEAVNQMWRFLPDSIYLMISGCQVFCKAATIKNTGTYAVLQKPLSIDGIARFITNDMQAADNKKANISSKIGK